MNDIFTDQKEKLVSISHEINLLRQQVNYLLRNEKALGLLDLDVLMNRTHAIYDLLCSVNMGNDADNSDLDFDPEALAAFFAPAADDLEEPVLEPAVEPVAVGEPVLEPAVESVAVGEPVLEPAVEPVAVEEPVLEPAVESVVVEEPFVEPAVEPVAVEETQADPVANKPLGDEYGFLFRFEDVPPAVATPEPVEEPVGGQSPVVIDGKTVHFVEEVPEHEIPERDRVVADELLRDTLFEMPHVEDMGFEMASGETLGESMMREDHSIAAKLQQSPVTDLRSNIGINDKFLFVNELFGGSMEKYNKSIDNLNDLKTLNGAMIYLNELKIELQWNSSNEAYRKLTDLVRRKFE